MAITQDTYTERRDAYSEGQIVTSTPYKVDSREVVETDGIAFGRAVGQHRGATRAADKAYAGILGVGALIRAASFAADDDNTGGGALSAATFGRLVRSGRYTAVFTGATAGNVYGPEGEYIRSFSAAGAQAAGLAIGFTFTASGTAMSSGDELYADVEVLGERFDFVGVSVKDKTRSPLDDDSYKNGAIASVITEGDVGVKPETAVNVGDPAFFDADTGRLSSDAGKVPIVDARWQTAAAADGIAVLRLNA